MLWVLMRLMVRRIFAAALSAYAHAAPPAMTITRSGKCLRLPQQSKPAQAGFEGMPPLNHKKHRRPLAVKARAGRLRTARLVLALTDKGRWCKITPTEGAYPALCRLISLQRLFHQTPRLSDEYSGFCKFCFVDAFGGIGPICNLIHIVANSR